MRSFNKIFPILIHRDKGPTKSDNRVQRTVMPKERDCLQQE